MGLIVEAPYPPPLLHNCHRDIIFWLSLLSLGAHLFDFVEVARKGCWSPRPLILTLTHSLTLMYSSRPSRLMGLIAEAPYPPPLLRNCRRDIIFRLSLLSLGVHLFAARKGAETNQ